MSWIRTLVINIFVLSGLLLATEIGARIAWTTQKCYTEVCDFSRLLRLKIYEDSLVIVDPLWKHIGLYFVYNY